MGLLPSDHVYSYSQLSSFDECSYNFYLQRIEGLREEASNAFAERGSLIHDLLDQWAKKILTKEDMINEYERRYSSEVVTAFPRMLAAKGYAKKSYEQGIEFLENFDEFEGYEVLSAEEKFKINIPLSDGTTRPFVGIIDMMLREIKSGDLIICDHKSKSMSSFKKDEDKMYRQQLIYATYVKEKYGQFPQVMMFHLFNESGVKPQRLFSVDQYDETMEWATKQIKGIEEYSVIDWLSCKEKPDFFCWYLCSSRKECPNGVVPDFRKKKKEEEYEGFND
ncbi:MAG: PD-(D/E)XK nuclease family protein [Paludibacteraceae bacterium]|nr:PD-(D/E)XK nuclease family protein [Paludibacteraceae bacterium]